jgi:hypothetical protein
LIAVVVLLSLPLFAFPEIAYAKNGHGFQGILNHPQTFGPVLAPATSALLAGLLFRRPKSFSLLVAVSLSLIALMIASQARTALATVILSIGATTLVMFFKKRKYSEFRIGRLFAFSVLGLVGLVVVTTTSEVIRDKLIGFVYKRNSTTMESALASRSGGIESQWNQFLDSPIGGHGFGVYPWGLGSSEAVEFMGVPISAPVEKGFLPTAILEETGLIGALGFLVVLYFLGRNVIQQGNCQWLALLFACIFVNVGEMVIFSVGGIGLFYWLMIGVATRVPANMVQSDATVARLKNPFASSFAGRILRHLPVGPVKQP